MSETANIAEIAVKISKDIFKHFLWETHPKRDDNFKCVNAEHLGNGNKPKDTHPGDVVFFYEDPYLGKRIYLHTDLKSYAKDSINSTSLRSAFKSLCMTVECAKESSEWRNKYSVDASEPHEVRGMLFIHNHDNGYDSLPGFTRRDVTDVYVYKAKPEQDEESDDSSVSDPDTHVERVFLRGRGVTRSELLNELLDEDDYYITKISWTAKEIMGSGNDYDIEAVFADPKNCTGFSFILTGVYPFEDGKTSTRRRAPYKREIDAISRVIESKSRELVAKIREEFASSNTGGA